MKGRGVKFDFIDLKLFLAAIDGGSLTAAAAQNNVVVAGVSTRLRRLEQAFDLELFERTGRGIRPTLAGQMLARQARKVMDDARRIEVDLGEFAYGRSGRVRLLSNTNMLAEHLPQVLGSFLAKNIDIDVTVEDRPSFEVVNMLRNGDADIGIVASSADTTGLERSRFIDDQLVLVVPHDFEPIADGVDYAAILGFPMIGLQEKTALSQFLKRLANELGHDLRCRMRSGGFEAICRMVESGAGVAIVPKTAALRYATFMQLRILQIGEDWAKRELYLCFRSRSQLPGYAVELLRHLQDYAKTSGAGTV